MNRTTASVVVLGDAALVTGFALLAVAWDSPIYLLCAAVILAGALLATWMTFRKPPPTR